MERLKTAAAPLVLLLTVAGCGAHAAHGTKARLRVIAKPKTASVYIDDRFAGSAQVLDKRPEELSAGQHLVTVRAPGYFPHDLELDLPAGTTKVEIELRPVPP